MSLAPIVDSHCHLDVDAFADDLPDVIARAREAGVVRMVAIAQRLPDLERVLEISETYEDVFCAVGIHPHKARTESATTAGELTKLAVHPRIVGIGECGLDYHYYTDPLDHAAQADGFRVHIEACRKTGLPLIVHTRAADEDTIRILEEEFARGPFTGVLHCFSSSRELAERAVAIGMYVSLSGIVTFRNAEEIRDAVRALPVDRLLVETDSPFLAPVPKRGKRCEPAFVRHTHDFVAGLKGLSPEAFAQVSTENFHRLFKKVPRADGRLVS